MTAQALFDEVAAEYLSRRDVSVGRMLRSDGLKVNGKVFALLVDDRLVVKVPAKEASALVAAGEAEAFQSGGGRTMREWVSVAPDRDAWRRLMADAVAYVESLARS